MRGTEIANLRNYAAALVHSTLKLIGYKQNATAGFGVCSHYLPNVKLLGGDLIEHACLHGGLRAGQMPKPKGSNAFNQTKQSKNSKAIPEAISKPKFRP